MSGVVKRSVAIRGHRTSFSLEHAFFDALNALAEKRGLRLAALITEVDERRSRSSSLSSALRLFVLEAAKRGELAVGGSELARRAG